MLDTLVDGGGRLDAGLPLDKQLDRTHEAMQAFGFATLIYDYTPVPWTHDGAMIAPSLLCLRNAPDDMFERWCEHGYYERDPVQQVAMRTHAPFTWCYRAEAGTVINGMIDDSHRPVVDYLHDSGMVYGATVPLHMPGGGYATLTGICRGADAGAEAEARHRLADFALLAHVFHAGAYPHYAPSAHVTKAVSLSARERECLQFAAEGLTAKEIAWRLNRSIATVVMHLNAATRKLGARNRVQAVTIAAHYRLL